MALRKSSGKARNSEGIEGKAIWGKRADWVHYHGTVKGKAAGIAFMSHPSNLTRKGEKSWWHARDYGLISANPFAPKKLGEMESIASPVVKASNFDTDLFFTAVRLRMQRLAKDLRSMPKTQGHPTSLMPPHPGYPEDYLSQKKK